MARNKALTIGMVGALSLSALSPAEAAGLFDDLARALFGGGRSAPPTLMMNDPFEMTVQPRRQRPRPAATKPPEPAVKLDPASDAHWYLRDTTLRKGDIVVTSSGVVVFDGQSSTAHSQADFTALNEARRLPKAQRLALEAAAAGGRAYFTPATASETSPPTRDAKGADVTAQAQ